MPLILTAAPASVETTKHGDVWGYKLCDPDEIAQTGASKSLADAQAEFESFVAGLAAGRWVVHGSWSGPDAPPRGFKAAVKRRAFYRQVHSLAKAA